MNHLNKVIYADCDGVLLNWTGNFYRWAYENHGISVKDQKSKSYALETHMDCSAEKASEMMAQFNSSERLAYLPPLRDAVKYIRKLYEECGYSIIAISALGRKDKGMYAYNRTEFRTNNLKDHFGEAIKDVICVDSDKKPYLIKFKQIEYGIRNMRHDSPVYWVEDHPGNAKLGFDMGFETILMDGTYNQDAKMGIHYDMRVRNWEDIYNNITNRSEYLK